MRINSSVFNANKAMFIKDKRNSQRFELPLSGKLTGNTGTVLDEPLVLDISSGGIAVLMHISNKNTLGSILELSIDAPCKTRKAAVYCQTMLTWVKELKNGIKNSKHNIIGGGRFLLINPKDKEILLDYAKTLYYSRRQSFEHDNPVIFRNKSLW